MIHIKNFHFNLFRECCYVVWDDTGEGVIIDPGFFSEEEKESLFSFIGKKGITPVKILLTHGHFDHIYGLKECADTFKIPVYMSPDDKDIFYGADWFKEKYGVETPETDVTLTDIREGDTTGFGNTEFEVIATPGHCPGSVCFLDRKDKVLFSGDTLFAGSIGRTDHPGGDYDVLMQSITGKLMDLDGDIEVFPGHGPATTIADERTKNPFLMPFNFPMDDTGME